MKFSDYPPFILIPAYFAVMIIFCLFWFIAVPVCCLAQLIFILAEQMIRVMRVVDQFDVYLSKTLDQLWEGII